MMCRPFIKNWKLAASWELASSDESRAICRFEKMLAPGAGQNHVKRFGDQGDVQPHAPRINIFKIEFYIVVKGRALAAVDLPQSGQSGNNFQAAKMFHRVLFEFIGD